MCVLATYRKFNIEIENTFTQMVMEVVLVGIAYVANKIEMKIEKQQGNCVYVR